jgi:hypothetical protein
MWMTGIQSGWTCSKCCTPSFENLRPICPASRPPDDDVYPLVRLAVFNLLRFVLQNPCPAAPSGRSVAEWPLLEGIYRYLCAISKKMLLCYGKITTLRRSDNNDS